ncbi:hypothetical protein [Caulobacter sp. UNC279MFTsu5.1]|uniref:hypothetical protein n=1 Tax=Caulobacter sp. UNC279MFTsu5.1 TaxID=1502775 RepID=UPI00037968DC|nr:hypothetical protein [Caulobacter sp. UNC279MFTsu5.1]SFK42279.1 hypothetical protein SAMN02799626_04260 [Caulobacter sp. UNC279MFTsu5.1]
MAKILLTNPELVALIGEMIEDERAWDPAWVAVLCDRFRDLQRDHGAEVIRTERVRQVREEGFDADHDDQNYPGQLAEAGYCYILSALRFVSGHAPADIQRAPPPGWPWALEWWKPKSASRDLARAGALIAAELGRRKRQHDAFVALVVQACVAGGADREDAQAIVEMSIDDALAGDRIEVGHPDHDWGVAGAAALADELVLHHLEGGQA